MARTFDVSIYDTRGGLNLRASDRAVKRNEARAAQNCEISYDSSILKANGYERFDDQTTNPAGDIDFLFLYHKDNGTEQIIATDSTKMYTVSTSGVFTSRITGLTNSTYGAWCLTFNNYLLLMNGVDTIKTWDGSAAGTLTGFPGDLPVSTAYPSLGAVWKNRLWLTGDPGAPYRVYVSAAGDHNDFTTANGAFAVDVNVSDGEIITGISPFFDSLVVYKTNSIHSVVGDSAPGSGGANEFVIKPISNGVSSVAPRAVLTVGNDQFYFGKDHISSLKTTNAYGDILTSVVSDKIQPIIETLNVDAMRKAFIVHYRLKNQVWFCFPTGGSSTNNAVYIFDYRTGAWMKRQGFSPSCGMIYDNKPLLGTYSGAGLQLHDFGGTYEGNPIQAYWTTGWEGFSNYLKTKRIRNADVTVKRLGEWSVRVDAAWDYQTFYPQFNIDTSPVGGSASWGTAVWGSARWATETSVQSRTLSQIGMGKALQLKFSNNFADQPFEIMGWDFAIQERGYRSAAYE